MFESTFDHEHEFVKAEVSLLWEDFIGGVQFSRLLRAGMVRDDHDRALAQYPRLGLFFSEGLPTVITSGAVVMTFPQDDGNRIDLSLELGHMIGEFSIHEQFGRVIPDPNRQLYQFEDIIPQRPLQKSDLARVKAVLMHIRNIHDAIPDEESRV
jgi:hypothetical protein